MSFFPFTVWLNINGLSVKTNILQLVGEKSLCLQLNWKEKKTIYYEHIVQIGSYKIKYGLSVILFPLNKTQSIPFTKFPQSFVTFLAVTQPLSAYLCWSLNCRHNLAFFLSFNDSGEYSHLIKPTANYSLRLF